VGWGVGVGEGGVRTVRAVGGGFVGEAVVDVGFGLGCWKPVALEVGLWVVSYVDKFSWGGSVYFSLLALLPGSLDAIPTLNHVGLEADGAWSTM